MTRANDRTRAVLQRFHVRFFWQLVVAFTLVTILVGGGMFLAGRAALDRLAVFTQDSPWLASRLWTDRLADYYRQHGSWEGVDALIGNYPCGTGWEAGDPEWQVSYLLADAGGTVVAASEGERIGQLLDPAGLAWIAPIRVDDQQVGSLHLSPFEKLAFTTRAPHRPPWRGFLFAGLVIGGCSLVVGLILSRGMSRPLVRLASATRAVAAGDLSARVATHYPGEMGELAVAFNQMAEELARADELRRNMTADVAHELRTPLSVIRGKLEGVLDGVYPATAEHLEPVLEETGLLTRLVEDLRLLALAEAGQLTLETRPIDVGDLLRDAHVNFSPQASDRGVTLALDLAEQLPEVKADQRRIAQVLGNLVTNALRHTPQAGCVTLSARAGDGAVTVTVTDSGVGVPAEDVPYIFERFWRGEKSRSRAGGGSGLGLAIARQLVEMQGGVIGVESAPGDGARFWFTLPTREPTDRGERDTRP